MPVQTMLISTFDVPVKTLSYHGAVSRRCVLVTASVVVTVMLTGFLLGWLYARGVYGSGSPSDSSNASNSGEGNGSKATHRLDRDFEADLAEKLMKEIKSKRIEHHLRWLTSSNRVAGTDMDLKQAEILRQLWLNYGLDNAGIESYPALLSYPGNHSNPNRVEVIDNNGTILFNSTSTEKPVALSEDPEGVTLPYFAYSKPGIIESDVIYANYGNDSDYFFLQSNYGMNISGKIALVRSGSTSRFNKVDVAAKYGVAGLLIFPDMTHNGPEGRHATYPSTWWLPGDATERGGMYSINGDPLTPVYPAKDYALRRTKDEIEKRVLTPIPVQPVSVNGAIALLEHLAEDTPTGPDQWFDWQRGWVSNRQLKYLGGRQKENRKVRLIVNNRLEVRNTYNVFGLVKGEVEPDRLVILGNHRDAWGRGAVDPGGGTAVMLEVSRAVGVLLQDHHWKPRRTIIFASWGAEEFGLIGSTEWVEEKLTVLSHKAVAYLNLDVVVTGRGPPVAKASSTLFETLFKAANNVPHPQFKTVFEAWSNQSVGVWPLQPNSDFKPFYYLAGVPSLTVTCTDKESLYPFYPTYHTEYDVFDYVKRHIDPTFEYHRLIGQLHAYMMLLLADSLILPLDATPGAELLEKEFAYLKHFFSRHSWFKATQGSQFVEHLDHCIHNFSVDARHLRDRSKLPDKSNPYAVRHLNDQLMLVERAFINLRWKQENKDPMFQEVGAGPKLRAMIRNYLKGSDVRMLTLLNRDSSKGSPKGISTCINVNGFPGIKDFLCDPEVQVYLQKEEIPLVLLERITREVAAICYALHSATDMMNV